MENEKANQSTQVQKAATINQVNKTKGNGGNVGKGNEKKSLIPQASASSNPFVVLSSAEDNFIVLEEGEVQAFEEQIEEGEVHLVSMENPEPVILEIPMTDSITQENPMEYSIMQEPLNSPVGVTSPPSYAEILKKKSVESSGSSGKDEHFTKKVGRKS